MEYRNAELGESPAGTNKKPKRFYSASSTGQSPIITEDLASFYIAHKVVTEGVESVASLKTQLEDFPDLVDVIDSILTRLENASVIRVEGDKITVLKGGELLDGGGDPDELQRFFPNLLRTASRRVIQNERENREERKRRKEYIRYFVVADEPEFAKEANEIYLEYKAKMLELICRSSANGKESSGLRFIATINSVLEPEDFV